MIFYLYIITPRPSVRPSICETFSEKYQTHIDDFLAILEVFENFLELTGDDVIIPGNMVIFCEASSQIDCILRKIGAKFGAFSTICTISLFFNTIQ